MIFTKIFQVSLFQILKQLMRKFGSKHAICPNTSETRKKIV